MCIPDGLVEFGERCFYECKRLRRCSFDASSRLERIYAFAFSDASFESVCIPNSVIELCNGCFYDCKRLQSVTFGV